MGLKVGQNNQRVLRSINTTQANREKATRQIASGKRIEFAADDAAGSQIAESFTTQIKGSVRAARNAYDGIHLAKHADKSLEQISNILVSMRELAVQSANDINTAEQRQSLDSAVQQFVDEVDNIAHKSDYGTIRLLDGSFINKALHIGTEYQNATRVQIQNSSADYLGRYAVQDTEAVNGERLNRGDLLINGIKIRGTTEVDDALSSTMARTSAIAKAEAINDSQRLSQVTAFVNRTKLTGTHTVDGGVLDRENHIVINGEVIAGFEVLDADGNDRLIDTINGFTNTTGVHATLNADGRLELTADDGRNIHVHSVGLGHEITGLDRQAGDRIDRSHLTLFSRDLISITDPNNAQGEFKIGVDEDDLIGVNELQVLSTIDVRTRDSANKALTIITRAQEAVLKARGQLAGLENRLEFTVNRLNEAGQKAYAAREKVVEADLAHSTAELSRNTIVQNAFTNVLAQANQDSFRVLSLL